MNAQQKRRFGLSGKSRSNESSECHSDVSHLLEVEGKEGGPNMKHNLKNRPKHPNIVWDQDYETWFEGFEKELRELKIMDWLDQNHPLGKQWSTKEAHLIDTIAKFRDELLGVSGGEDSAKTETKRK